MNAEQEQQLDQTYISQLLRQGMIQLSNSIWGIQMTLQSQSVTQTDWTTVYTIADGVMPLMVAVYAPEKVVRRACVNVLGEDGLTSLELEECAMEHMNIMAGWVVSQLYQQLGKQVTLYPPHFCAGRHQPFPELDAGEQIYFLTDRGEGVEVHWSSPQKGISKEDLFVFRGDKT